MEDDRAAVLPRMQTELRVETGNGFTTIRSRHEQPWTHDAFRIDTVIPMRLGTAVVDDGNSFTVSVDNNTRYLLLHGSFMYRGLLYRTGPFAPGDTITQSFRKSTAPVSTSLTEFVETWGPIDPVVESGLSRLLVEEKWRVLQERGYVFYIAWLTDPLLEVRSEELFRTTVDSSYLVVIVDPDDKPQYSRTGDR